MSQYISSPCDNLTFWRLLQIDGGSTWHWPTVHGAAQEETHLKAELATLRRDQGGDGGRHGDGEVPHVASLDVREQRPEQFAGLPVGKLTLSPLVANPHHGRVGSLLQPSLKRSSSDSVGRGGVLRQPQVHHLLPLAHRVAHQVRQDVCARDQVLSGRWVD